MKYFRTVKIPITEFFGTFFDVLNVSNLSVCTWLNTICIIILLIEGRMAKWPQNNVGGLEFYLRCSLFKKKKQLRRQMAGKNIEISIKLLLYLKSPKASLIEESLRKFISIYAKDCRLPL